MSSSIFLGIVLLTLQIPELKQSPAAILDRTALDIRRNVPSMQYGRPVCNIPPLLTKQEDFSCASFYIGSAPGPGFKILASVTIHQIPDAATVSRWIANVPARPAEWVVVPYDLGVPAYISTLQGSAGVEIIFGKGRFIVTVNGISKADVDRVARSLLGQIVD